MDFSLFRKACAVWLGFDQSHMCPYGHFSQSARTRDVNLFTSAIFHDFTDNSSREDCGWPTYLWITAPSVKNWPQLPKPFKE